MTTDSILVVDDEDRIRDLVVNYLKTRGYQVSAATSERRLSNISNGVTWTWWSPTSRCLV